MKSQDDIRNIIPLAGNKINTIGRLPINNQKTSDSLQHRTSTEDSITISFKYFDNTHIQKIDTNVLNLNNEFPVPVNYLYLGNLGSASRNILFSPRMSVGFDAGFHAYDIYQYKLEDTKFFRTTRPFTQLNYILASRAEQTIKILHTQNLKPLWNVGFEYRFITSPGFFKNVQNTNHSIRISSSFNTKHRRYSGFLVFIDNKLSAGESGGIANLDFLNDISYDNRFLIPTILGKDQQFNNNFFASTDVTGALYKNTQLFFRHQYDFGQKDSLISDSNVLRLFYPRFRIQHSMSISGSNYSFRDNASVDSIRKYYHYNSISDTIFFKDVWKEFKNEFALVLFPEKYNQNQYLKTGIALQLLKGIIQNITSLHNVYLTGEYRNTTRNKKWDIEANGQLYINGYNSGDYNASIKMNALLGTKNGIEIGFENSNQSPSFIFNDSSNFPLLPANGSFKKQNITHLFASIKTKFNLILSGNYYLVNNYIYWDSFYHASQSSALINVLHLSAEKKFRLSKHWNIYSEIHLQQATENLINLPIIYTRQRIVFEGSFFKNLNLATGIDIRYFTPFSADNYSPITQQFFVQYDSTINNRPDIAAFFHFNIKRFNAFVRFENLNTINFTPNFGFLKNNFAAPMYPTPGLIFRLGIKWNFVN